MKSTVFAIIFSLSLLSPHLAAAGGRCDSLFQGNLNQVLSAAQLDKLKEQNFKIDNNNFLVDLSSEKKLLKIEIINAPYLYEWASQKEQQDWIKTGSVSKADMDFMIESRPQLYGKGYYVSTNPFDSAVYGSSLTVFKPGRPLMTLEYASWFIEKTSIPNGYSTELVNRLRKAGIDGVRGSLTWIAIFNEKVLKTTDEVIKDPAFLSVDESPDKNTVEVSPDDIAQKMQTSGLWKQIPDQSIFKQTYEKTFSPEFNGSYLLTEKNPAALQEHWNNIIQKTNLLAAPDFYKNLEDQFGPQANKALRSVFKYFDLFTLSKLYRTKLKEIPNMKYVADASRKIEARRQTIQLGKIRNFENFKEAVNTLLGKKVDVRNYAVVMSGEKAKSKNTIQMLPSVFDQLKFRNKILSVTDKTKSTGQALHNYEIEYLNVPRILDNGFINALSPRLVQRFKNYQAQFKSTDDLARAPETRESKQLLHDALEELTAILFKPESQEAFRLVLASGGFVATDFTARADFLYLAFISIHPFKDGNGRASRLYYEWLQKKLKINRGPLELASFDLDIFTFGLGLDKLNQISKAMNAWISTSKDETEFKSRLEIARSVIAKQYQESMSVLEN